MGVVVGDAVGVLVDVAVMVGVAVRVAVAVGVAVGVRVGVGDCVAVGVAVPKWGSSHHQQPVANRHYDAAGWNGQVRQQHSAIGIRTVDHKLPPLYVLWQRGGEFPWGWSDWRRFRSGSELYVGISRPTGSCYSCARWEER